MSNPKTINLNISERLSSLGILNSFRGNVETLSHVLEDIKQFSITPEDWERAEKKTESGKDETGKVVEKWSWNNEKGGEKEISLQKETIDYILKVIEEKSQANEITMDDAPLLSIREKIK